ncbi:MAG: branched-chain amino acid ABC transporter permease [Actinomycetota bacterium]|nr:branched-chain amino acid ABC transporter permease [Actinomycetota bacterium]
MLEVALPLAVDWGGIFNVDFLIQVMAISGIYAILAMGLQVNVGYTGIANFGQAGFAAMGAYVMAVLVTGGPDGDGLLSFWIALPVAILVTMAFGVLVGTVSLRLRADYLAIATIAAAEAVRIFAQNADSITGGNQPLFGFDSSFESITDGIEDFFESAFGWETPLYTGFVVVIWTTLIISAVVLTRMQRTPWGRVLRAVREDEEAARALGKNTFSYKLQSLAVGSFFGAIGGAFLAMYFGVINPNNFEPAITFLAYGVLILGGLASYWGVLVGAFVLYALIESTRYLDIGLSATQEASLRFMVVGLVLILLMAFRPQGLFGKREEMVIGD